VSFEVAAAAYDRFMGRYSRLLATQMADFAGVSAGQRVLDVGSGPGALTAELVRRVGASAVAAVDPSAMFVDAVRERLPGVKAEREAAEALSFADGVFDAALAQLVVHFMADPVGGLGEMARVTAAGGVVAACVWDHAGERSPVAVFWRAARELDPGARDESGLPGAREGDLPDLLRRAGLRRVVASEFDVPFAHASFQEWWEPFTLGVGPAGQYLTQLSDNAVARLRERCRALLPSAARPVAWAARGVVA
jgi:SAM-dependent methyltransferase